MKNKYLFILFFTALFSVSCSSADIIEPPRFRYSEVYPAYFLQNPGGHLPLTVQEGVSLHPYVSGNYLFYSSTSAGVSDIWLRDLTSTVNIPVVRHSSRQHSPAFHPLENRLVYVTEDRNPAGSLNIVNISPEPEQLFFSALRGRTPVNLMASSEDLSSEIQKYFEKIPGCSLPSSDRSPVWKPDGSGIYYLSDRCQPGRTDLWFVSLNNLRPSGIPVRITFSGADQYALSGDGTAAVTLTFTSADRGGRFTLIRNPEDNNRSSEIITIPATGKDMNLYLYPALDRTGTYLYYAAVRTDADGNGRPDPSDPAGIYTVDLRNPKTEIQLLESREPLYSLRYSDFESGTLLYSAALGKTINIHYIYKKGIIPEEKNIRGQYESAARFRKASPERYLLALMAVRNFFGNSPEYPVYESRILQEIRSFFPAQLKEQALAAMSPKKPGPLSSLDEELSSVPPEKQKNIYLKYLSVTDKPGQEPLYTLLSDRYIKYLFARKNYSEVSSVSSAFLRQFPDYTERAEITALKGLSELYLNGRFSDSLKNFYRASQPSFSVKDRTTDSVWQYIKNQSDPSSAAELLLKEADLPSELRKTLLLVKADVLFRKGDLTAANSTLNSVTEGTEPGSALFIRSFRLRALIAERLGNISGAEAARLAYGGSYRSDGAVKLTIDEFQDIIENAENSMNRYLRTARSVNRTVDAEAFRQNTLLLRIGTNAGISDYTDLKTALSPGDRDTLAFFCSPESNTLDIIMRTGQQRYVQSLLGLCQRNSGYFNGSSPELPLIRDAETAADLLYLNSYIQANLLNILFFNIRKTGQFQEFYSRYSVKYHRMKADTAMERNRILLDAGRRKTALISTKSLKSIVKEEDPFDAATFNEILHGYQLASEEARQIRDLSLIYGYAYTLIQKSVEREMFYDELQREGTVFPESTLKEKKNAVLADLKRAEHQLQYILYTDPSYTDAYLLLGWMYQYIDSRRQTRVFVRPGYANRLVNWVFNVKERKETDGIYYYRNYSAYFPDRLYETNVSLYESAASFDSLARTTAEKTALNLNLANNYFMLMNFGKAAEKYGKVKENLNKTSLFRNYRERALFHYHYGRSLYYENYHAEAARELGEAGRLYETHELKPLAEKYNTALFLSETPGAYLTDQLSDVHEKLYIISALTGLAYHESGEYHGAAAALEKALSHYRPAFADRRNAAGVYNQLALTWQKEYRFPESDSSALKAAEISLEKELATEYERFIPETFGGRVLGYFLQYNEDFFIIGEGRNPYGFSPLRHYELSQGIRMENLLRSGDFRKASALAAERLKTFSELDSGTWSGRTGIVNTINLQAFNLFSAGDYSSASLKFREAADSAKASGNLVLYRKNTINYYNSLFALLDSGEIRPESALHIINDEIAALSQFRDSYREKYKEQYIYNRKTESPDFVYNPETDDPVVEKNITADLFGFTGTESLLFYYKGFYYLKNAKNENDLRIAHANAGTSVVFAENALSTLSASEKRTRPDAFRMQINLARSWRLKGNLLRSAFILTELLESAREFRMISGEWNALWELALTETEIYIHTGNRESLTKADQYYRDAWKVLTAHPEIFSEIKDRYTGFYESKIRFLFQHGDPGLIPETEETYWYHFLFNEFTKYAVSFKNEELTRSFSSYTEALAGLRRARHEETSVRQSFLPFKDTAGRTSEAERILAEKKQQLIRLKPGLAAFLKFPYIQGNLRPALRRNQVLVKIKLFKNTLHLWSWSPKGNNYLKNDSAAGHEEKTADLLKTLLKKMPPETEVIILPDPEIFELSWKEIWEKAGLQNPLPVFTSRISDTFIPFYNRESDIAPEDSVWHRFNISGITAVKKGSDFSDVSDIADFYGDDWKDPDGLINDSAYHYRRWIGSESTASAALLNIDRGPDRYKKAAYIYEIVRANGAASVLLYDSAAEDRIRSFLEIKGKRPYTESGLRTFGFPGFRKDSLGKTLENIKNKYILNSYALAASGDYRSALKNAGTAASLSEDPDAGLLAAGWRLLLSSGRQGAEDGENLIFTSEKKGIDLSQGNGYRVFAEALLRTGHTDQAVKYLRPLGESEKNLLYLSSGLSLRSFHPDKKNQFQEVFRSALAEIRNRPGKIREISEGLLRHARHGEIRNLQANREAEMDYRLLYNHKIPEENPLLYLPETEDSGLILFRSALKDAWEDLKNHRNPDLLKLNNRNSIYGRLSIAERSLLFYILLQKTSSDPGLLTAQMILELTEAELKSTGYDRAGIMAVSTALFTAESGDPVTAGRFLNLYKSYKDFMIPSEDAALVQKRTEEMLSIREVSVYSQENLLRTGSVAELTAARNRLLTDTDRFLLMKDWDSAFEACHLMNIIDLKISGLPVSPGTDHYAARIRKALPEGQRFSALCAGSDTAYRITFTSSGTAADPLNIRERYLKGKLTELLSAQEDSLLRKNLLEELRQLYSPFFSAVPGSVGYVWLPGIHILAPSQPDRFTSVYLVPDVDTFLRSVPKGHGKEFDKKTGVRFEGAKNVASDYSVMERITIAAFNAGREIRKNGPVHLDSESDFFRRIKESDHFWFFTGSQLNPAVPEDRRMLLGRIYRSASAAAAPGIYRIQKKSSLADAYYIKYFYESAAGSPSMMSRIYNSYEKVRRYQGGTAPFGYLVITPSILKN